MNFAFLSSNSLRSGPKPRTKQAVPYWTARSPSERSVWAQPGQRSEYGGRLKGGRMASNQAAGPQCIALGFGCNQTAAA